MSSKFGNYSIRRNGIASILILMAAASFTEAATPLEEYVWREIENDAFSLEPMATYFIPGALMHVVKVTSLEWMNDNLTNPNIWRHWMTVIVPNDLRITDAAFLRLSGGDGNRLPPDPENYSPVTEHLIKFALDTGAVAAEMSSLPYQPMTFPDTDGTDEFRSNDVIAKSILMYIDGDYNNTDNLWIMPTARAARRGIDALIDFISVANVANITKVMLQSTGARGLTSFLMAGLDDRVFAIAPQGQTQLVYEEFVKQHLESFGGSSWMTAPFRELTCKSIFEERGQYVFDGIPIDPVHLESSASGTVSVFLTMGANDEYFTIDSTWNFWDKIPTKKYLRLVKDSGHTLRGHADSIWNNWANFFLLAHSESGPEVSWSRSEGTCDSQILTVNMDTKPNHIRAICVNSTEETAAVLESDWNGDGIPDTTPRRDFRAIYLGNAATFELKKNPLVWEENELVDLGHNAYLTNVEAPENGGFRACFIEMTFEMNYGIQDLIVTTEVAIAPDVRPFDFPSTFSECLAQPFV